MYLENGKSTVCEEKYLGNGRIGPVYMNALFVFIILAVDEVLNVQIHEKTVAQVKVSD